jgi:hypothetical protein
MVTRIDESLAPSQPQIADKVQENPLSRLDAYRDLAGLLVSGELAGTESGEFLKIFRSTASEISLTDLPFEVASMILENRATTMKEFFESWSASLEEQSKLDKESHERRELQKASLSPAERHFMSCLDSAERLGKVSTDEVNHLRGELNLLAAAGDVVSVTPKADGADQTQPALAALEPPRSGGITLRNTASDLSKA